MSRQLSFTPYGQESTHPLSDGGRGVRPKPNAITTDECLATLTAAIYTGKTTEGARPSPAEIVTPPIEVEVEITASWQPAYATAGSETERAFLRTLATRGLPAPDELGPELGDIGLPVDCAWSDLKVAIVAEPTTEDIADLAAEGWRLIGRDADSAVVALSRA